MHLVEITPAVLYAQLLLGLVNGAFYAILSLGLALIFGVLNIINFAHGVQYMMGAFIAWLILAYFGIHYWAALLIAPLAVAASAGIIERTLLKRLYNLDHLYGFLLTFGLALLIEGGFREAYGVSGQPYAVPKELVGAYDLGFIVLPTYRVWVLFSSVAACAITWLVIERTKLGSYLRAATEKPLLVRSFGVNVPRIITITYMLGAGLAALAGVMAAPIYQVSSIMGSNIIPVVFAVVVIGGLGSIAGSICAGFMVGLAEGLTKAIYPQAANTVAFLIMILVLLISPQGLFGRRA